MKAKNGLKRFFASLLVVVLLLTSAPLAGVADLDFSGVADWFMTTAKAATEGYLEYEVENGEATITDCDESISGEFVIPSTLGGYPVTSIGFRAFCDCTELTSITIPDSVTSIGDSAFWGCTGLTSVTIPDSVTSIDDWAFSGCTGLISVTIPDSVTYIVQGVFYGCTRLTSITIPDSVTSIGYAAFRDCTGLTSVTIPDSVTSIGSYAFFGCTGLTSVTIPDSVTDIGFLAFDGTPWYNAQPDGELYLGKVYYAYRGEMPENTSVTIKDGIKAVAPMAFRDCSNLIEVTIPESVENVGDVAFYNCTNLKKVNWNAESVNDFETGYTVFYNAGTAGSGIDVVFGDNVKHVPSHMFFCDWGRVEDEKNQPKVKSVKFGNSVESIGEYAFALCKDLESITLNSSISFDETSFIGCTGFKNMMFGSNVTNIGFEFLMSCTSTERLEVAEDNTVYHSINNCVIETQSKKLVIGCKNSVIPTDGSVTSIGEGAFVICSGLTSLEIPKSVTSIGEAAFSHCTGLTSVTIPNGVTSIGEGAFYDCTGLTSVTIPKSVTDIGDMAFGYYFDEETQEDAKLPDFTIYGYTGTAAETYATENGFTFISLDDEHTHSFSEWKVTKEATCTEEGEETRSCSCGETQARKIEKIDHVMFTVVEPSTCKVKGVSYDVCDMCNETFNYTVLPLAPHTFSAWTVTKKATCETAGEKTRACSVCGTSETEEISALEHSFKHVLKNATCKEEGFEKDVCENCGKEINAKVLPVTAHTFSAWTVTKEATVFESGERVRSCSVCGFEEKETIEKLKSEEVKDEKTDVSVICPDGSYDGKVEIEVKETFDGESYHILNSERGNYKKSLFDITTFVDGKKAQPNGSVWVKIPLPESYNPEKTTVYHVTNEGKLEKIESHVEGGYIIFETTHFSYYAIVDEGSQINPSSNCSCACHKKGIAKFFFKIKLFFQKIFKKNKVCKCRVWHY